MRKSSPIEQWKGTQVSGGRVTCCSMQRWPLTQKVTCVAKRRPPDHGIESIGKKIATQYAEGFTYHQNCLKLGELFCGGWGNTLSWAIFQHPRRPAVRVFPKGTLNGWGLSDDLQGPFPLLWVSWCQCPNPRHQIKNWKKKITSLEWRELTFHSLALIFSSHNLKIGSLQQ